MRWPILGEGISKHAPHSILVLMGMFVVGGFGIWAGDYVVSKHTANSNNGLKHFYHGLQLHYSWVVGSRNQCTRCSFLPSLLGPRNH